MAHISSWNRSAQRTCVKAKWVGFWMRCPESQAWRIYKQEWLQSPNPTLQSQRPCLWVLSMCLPPLKCHWSCIMLYNVVVFADPAGRRGGHPNHPLAAHGGLCLGPAPSHHKLPNWSLWRRRDRWQNKKKLFVTWRSIKTRDPANRNRSAITNGKIWNDLVLTWTTDFHRTFIFRERLWGGSCEPVCKFS